MGKLLVLVLILRSRFHSIPIHFIEFPSVVTNLQYSRRSKMYEAEPYLVETNRAELPAFPTCPARSPFMGSIYPIQQAGPEPSPRPPGVPSPHAHLPSLCS